MDTLKEVWDQVLEYCKNTLSETLYKLWICDLETPEFINDKIIISVANEFKRSVISTRFDETFRTAFKEILGLDFEIAYVISDKPEEIPQKKEEEKNEGRKEYDFNSFIVGPSNKLAHAASWRVATAENLGAVYNPLFIYGNSGLGKTHLMMAIQNELKKTHDNIKIVYVTCEHFVNDFITCVRTKDFEPFRKKYREVDALFIDDIQFIKGKEAIQEEFFHTFNDLINTGKQIVITSDRPPKEIDELDIRIQTRFESGLVADIKPPEIEIRTAIIQNKADELGLKLSPSIVNYIAEKIKSNIRQLEGAVNKIAAMKSLHGTEPTMGNIQQILKDLSNEDKPVSKVVDEIIEYVADFYDVSQEDIKSDKRNASIILARGVAMYIVREITDLSLESVGSVFGGKKHSTVKHSIDKVESRIKNDIKFRTSIYNTIKQFRES